MTAVDPEIKNFVSFPVILQCLQELGSGTLLFIEYKLTDGRKAVGTGTNSAGLRSCKIISGASFSLFFSILDTVVEKEGSIRKGFSLSVCPIDPVQPLFHLVCPVMKLLPKAFQHIFHVLKVF